MPQQTVSFGVMTVHPLRASTRTVARCTRPKASGMTQPVREATRLFAAPVPSQNGLGIGLYQAAKQAEQLGYQLTLASNTDGRVCFELARTA